MARKTARTTPSAAPELVPGKTILCKIQGTPRGGNIFEATTGDEFYLVQLPNRFRKSLWIKPGSIVIVELVDESSKVRGEIVHVLLPDEVKERRKSASWCAQSIVWLWSNLFSDDIIIRPQSLDVTPATKEQQNASLVEPILPTANDEEQATSEHKKESSDQEDTDSDGDADLWQNTNRR